ncbi:alpha-2-macroglobulin [Microvirga sp. W0021]|uniref:Alpha-2-macroglobulin n=1 Tax=Hohaiivirga grylli TaxID=3133970 RepID=A0ABV0BGG6_9HYPH
MFRKLFNVLLISFIILIPSLASAEKLYVRKDMDYDFAQLEALLLKNASQREATDDKNLYVARTIINSNRAQAFSILGHYLLENHKSSASWLEVSKTLYAISTSAQSDRYTFSRQARTAAYQAYIVAKTPSEEANALVLLAQQYEARYDWRDALNAYSASLKIEHNPRVAATYATLREKYGFKYNDYQLESNTANPKICFSFSENLEQGRIDYSSFVTVREVTNPAIAISGRQLCVEGLKHGQTYNITLRQGIPSVVDETLRNPVNITAEIPDRAPQVSVIGKTYVLPATGQNGLPLTSVNTTKLDLEVYRIGDRNIVPAIRSENFLNQISGYTEKDIGLNSGVKVWSGTLDTQYDLNKDVVTTFPVAEALGKMEPGVYVLVAVPHSEKKSTDTSSSEDEYDESAWEQKATQWFVVSDLGITAFKGKDGIHVFARSLSSAQPIGKAEVRLLARNNDLLATKQLEAFGHVAFDPGLSRGTGALEPGMVVVATENDYNFINLNQTAFDLSDRGVKGRVASGAIDVYTYTERGVYRPNETVHITALMRDGQGLAVEKLPLTAIIRRPDGVEFRKVQVEDMGLGGRTLSLAIPADASHGTWRVAFYTDPKAAPVGSTTFLVEDYVAERLELNLTSQQKALHSGETGSIDIATRFLFGAASNNLRVTGEYSITQVSNSSLPALAGYVTGLSDEEPQTINGEIEGEIYTDEEGKASLSFAVPEITSTKPSEITISVEVAEDGGRAVRRSLTLPILPSGAIVGIKSAAEEIEGDKPAAFNAIIANQNGDTLAAGKIKWTLFRIERNYQWSNSDGRWSYDAIKNKIKVSEGIVSSDGKSPAVISTDVGWGSYILEASAPDFGQAAQASIQFYAGYSGDQTADTPDLLEMTLDKAAYQAGEQMQVKLSSRFDGQATLAVVSDKVRDIQVINVSKNGTNVTLPVKAEWGAGAYLVAIAHRPLDTVAKRLPGRALGLTWFEVDQDKRKLSVQIKAPASTLPGQETIIPVEINGAEKDEDLYVTLTAVDVGILNLTRYDSPNPTKYFFGQKQLSADILDLYGYLIDGMQGTRGAYRSGGDELPNKYDALPPTEEPLALFSGIVKVGPDGIAHIPLKLPAFNGSGRLMAVAWTKSRVGNASFDMAIRDPVVTLVTLPRFLSIGDQTNLYLQINNVEGPDGDYIAEFTVDERLTASPADLKKSLTLKKGQKTSLTVPVAALEYGKSVINMTLKGPQNDDTPINIHRSYNLGILPGTISNTHRITRTLKPSESLTLSSDLLENIIPGTGAATVSVSMLSELDVPGLLRELDRYPYGCTEQLVSRALPLLYLNSLAVTNAMATDDDVNERINNTIDRILTRQNTNGSFNTWSNGSNYWLDAYVADFLTRAREMKFSVPDQAFNRSLERLRNLVANTTQIEQNTPSLAYATYVLARNGRPVMGDLKYMVDTKMTAFKSPMALGQLASALSMLGDQERANKAFMAAEKALGNKTEERLYYYNYGSTLRDTAAVLALGTESKFSKESLSRLSKEVAIMTALRRYTSTQEKSWMVLAAQALTEASKDITLDIDGTSKQAPLYRSYRDTTLASKSVKVTNTSKQDIKAIINVLGNPLVPEPAVSQGYKVERNYYDLSGERVNPATVIQGTRLVTVITVTEQSATNANLLVVDRLPAGFEIDNPNLVDGSKSDKLGWVKNTVDATHTEYRDDRLVASFDRTYQSPRTFNIAYIVRAVSVGKYMHPSATAEDMYAPEKFGRSEFGSVEVISSEP